MGSPDAKWACSSTLSQSVVTRRRTCPRKQTKKKSKKPTNRMQTKAKTFQREAIADAKIINYWLKKISAWEQPCARTRERRHF